MLANLREAWRHPGTRLGLWSHFTSQFSGLVFAILWGYPFMVVGVGLSETTAGALLTLLVIGGILTGPILGRLTASYPLRRSNLVTCAARGERESVPASLIGLHNRKS